MSAANNRKQRISFTDKERQRLRLYHRSHPSLPPCQLGSWFKDQFGKKVSKPSIYDILSDKYAYLDNAKATDAVRKRKGPQWAELEDALFKWWQAVQPRDVTGKELKTKASEIWQNLPLCHKKKKPSFSDGWLSNWRARYGLSQSTKSMEAEPVSPEAGRMGDILCVLVANMPWAQQSIACPQFLSLTASNSSLPFTLPIKARPHLGHMNLSYSACRISVDSQFFSALPLTTKCHLPIALSNQGRSSIGTYKNAANFQGKMPCSKSTTVVALFDKSPWKGVQELSLKYNALKENDLILSDDVVNSFKPILSSLEYHYSWSDPQGVAVVNAEKAICLFIASEILRIQQAKDESQHLILEEWFLDFINYETLGSQSPEHKAMEVESTSNCSLRGVTRPKGSQCLTTTVSSFAKGGMVDICTWTYNSLDRSSDEQATQHFRAKIVFTPPATFSSVPQTTVHLATHTKSYTSTLLTPLISFRTIIPLDSEIFKIATFGTSTDLQILLSSGKASLTDCDPYGRSPINYAVRGCNCSTLKFLITKVEDIDAFEIGYPKAKTPVPLIRLLNSFDVLKDISKRNMRAECLKLMLLADADPTLPSGIGFTYFESELKIGTVAAMKALLDLGQPHVTVNSVSSPFGSTFGPPLFQLIRLYGHVDLFSLGLHEKVFLLLERGADITARNHFGESCLHVVLQFRADMTKPTLFEYLAYEEEEFKDILMCMVTAGADVYASNWHGKTVSHIACEYGYEELWREVLAECGYNPDEVFSLENEFGTDFRKYPGVRVFSTTAPVVRSTKLSFKEYGRQRKSLDCVRKVYSCEETGILEVWRDRSEFCEAGLESSDSENDEWVSRVKRRRREDRRKNAMKVRYPELLHNGVPLGSI